MKKHISKLLAVVGVAILCCMGCSLTGASALTLNDGVLSWKAVKDAAYYEVALGDLSTTCEEENLNLSKLCKLEGEHTITVSSVSDSDKKKEIGTMDVTVVALQKPSVSIMETDSGETCFTWVAEKGVTYAYNLHDGYGVKTVEAEEDGNCRVVMTNNNSTMFTVIVKESSEDNTYYMGNETSYRYQGKALFDMSDMVKYPFYTVSAGLGLDTLTFATTLDRGLYDLEMSFYLLDINGASLTGDGRWGRRIWNIKPQGEQLIWFCEEQIESYEGSADSLPAADEMVTYKVENVEIDKYGEGLLDLADFNVNEMIVIADIKVDGKSVMAEGFKEHGEEVIFDTSKLVDFLAVFKGTGAWYSEKPAESVLSIPVDLKDGVYELEVSYQLMDEDGKSLTGNGLWGRRITNGSLDDAELVWLCDYKLEPHSDGNDIPLPTETLTSNFSGKVENGIFKIMCLDFNADEIMAVSSVKKISGSSDRFNISNLKNYKYVHKDSAEYDPNTGEKFVIETTKCERGLFNVEISYYVMDSEGYMLTGNGMWGRRMMSDSEEEIWVCNTAPHEAHKDAENTVAEPNTVIKKVVQVALNKKGRFTLMMHDFKEGEIVVIEDVKYEGVSILK